MRALHLPSSQIDVQAGFQRSLNHLGLPAPKGGVRRGRDTWHALGERSPKMCVWWVLGFCTSISLQCPGEEADLGGEWPHGASRAAALAQNLCQR